MDTYDFSTCKVCNGRSKRRYRIRWPQGTFWIYVCSDCQLHYLNYLDNPAVSSSATHTSKEDAAYIEKELHSNLARYKNQIALVAARLPIAGARFLDVGAGGGLFLNLLKNQGAIVAGIEPNWVRRCYSKEKYGIELDEKDISHPYWQQGYKASFDGLFLWDVLEHVNFPGRIVSDAANLLKPGGYIFIDTPTRESLYYRVGEIAYWLTRGRYPLTLQTMYSPTPFNHKQIFTLRQLKNLLRCAGLGVVATKWFHELSFPCYFYLKRLLGSDLIARRAEPFVRTLIKIVRVRNKLLVIGCKSGDSVSEATRRMQLSEDKLRYGTH